MKKTIALMIVGMFSLSAFAQESSQELSIKQAEAKKNQHECYMMKDKSLLHCTGNKTEPQLKTVTLTNGTVIMPTGEVRTKDGKMSKLENGNCISMLGVIDECAKTHGPEKDRAGHDKPAKQGKEAEEKPAVLD